MHISNPLNRYIRRCIYYYQASKQKTNESNIKNEFEKNKPKFTNRFKQVEREKMSVCVVCACVASYACYVYRLTDYM